MTNARLIRERVISVIVKNYGRYEEELITTGLIDSLKAVQLAMQLEKTFTLSPDSFSLEDMQTITSLTKRIESMQIN